MAMSVPDTSAPYTSASLVGSGLVIADPVNRNLTSLGNGCLVFGSIRKRWMDSFLVPPPSGISSETLTSGPAASVFSPRAGLPGFRPTDSSALWTSLGLQSMVTTVSWAFLPLGSGQQATTSMG